MKQRDKETKLGPVGRLLKTSKQWTQGTNARTKKGPGNQCDPDSEKAKCWCLFGAVLKCYGDSNERWAAVTRLETALGRTLPSWNDKSGRKFSQVRKLLEATGV
jgi:hypothetical protein